MTLPLSKQVAVPVGHQPYDLPTPEVPVKFQLVTLAANADKVVYFTGYRKLVVLEATSLGTGAGEVSIAFTPDAQVMSDQFIKLSPGDHIQIPKTDVLVFRNNMPAQRQIRIGLSVDPDFEWKNFPRGM